MTAESDSPDAAAPATVTDPLAAALLEAEVLPWCVEILLAKVDRQVLEKQLSYHRHRLANGFPFKAHPAKFLFRACLNDYPPPQDYFATQNRPAVAEPQAPTPERSPATAPVVEMTREGAMTVIRMGMRSKLPVLREQALRLAAEWAIDPASLAG